MTEMKYSTRRIDHDLSANYFFSVIFLEPFQTEHDLSDEWSIFEEKSPRMRLPRVEPAFFLIWLLAYAVSFHHRSGRDTTSTLSPDYLSITFTKHYILSTYDSNNIC